MNYKIAGSAVLAILVMGGLLSSRAYIAHASTPTITKSPTGVIPVASPATSAGGSAPANTQSQIACIGKAVAVREAAIAKANTAFEASSNAAYKTRAAALATAYSGSSWAAVEAHTTAALSSFASAMSTATLTLQKTDTAASSVYSTAIVTCEKAAD